MDTEVCFRCDCPTGNAGKGDDSLYAPNGAGPYCHACFELVFELTNLRAENERLSASESNWHHVADLRAIEIDRLRAENERLKRDVEHYAQAILWEGDMIVTQTRYEQVQARIAELEAALATAKTEAAAQRALATLLERESPDPLTRIAAALERPSREWVAALVLAARAAGEAPWNREVHVAKTGADALLAEMGEG